PPARPVDTGKLRSASMRSCCPFFSFCSIFAPFTGAIVQIIETGVFLSPSVDALDAKVCILRSISKLESVRIRSAPGSKDNQPSCQTDVTALADHALAVSTADVWITQIAGTIREHRIAVAKRRTRRNGPSELSWPGRGRRNSLLCS